MNELRAENKRQNSYLNFLSSSDKFFIIAEIIVENIQSRRIDQQIFILYHNLNFKLPAFFFLPPSHRSFLVSLSVLLRILLLLLMGESGASSESPPSSAEETISSLTRASM